MRIATRRAASAVQYAVQPSRLLDGARPLVQPHHLRPRGVIDQMTGKPVQATNDKLGVELPNVDLTQSEWDWDEIEALKQASDEAGGILVFTNQRPEMTYHDQIRFVQAVADHDNTVIEPHAVSAGLPDAPQLLEIVREAGANVVFGENWHSDNSFHDETASYSILRGAEVPRLGVNDTLFSSVEDAWDALPQKKQDMLIDLRVYHSANRAYGGGHSGNSRAAMEKTSSMRFRDHMPILERDVLQPLVTMHPRTRRLGLYASPTFTTHVDGVSAEESKDILNFVYQWFARPEFCTRVSWHPNQVVMWDNRSLSHKGVADDVRERRVVQRVTVRGSAPMDHRGQVCPRTKKQAAEAGLFD